MEVPLGAHLLPLGMRFEGLLGLCLALQPPGACTMFLGAQLTRALQHMFNCPSGQWGLTKQGWLNASPTAGWAVTRSL